MKTLTFAAGIAAGYVLGTRAGREKYEQLVAGARNLANQPAVVKAQSRVKDAVGQGTRAVGAKVDRAADNLESMSGTTSATRSSSSKPTVSQTTPMDPTF